MPNNEYMTPSDVVERYKGVISLKTLANWRVKKEGPSYTKIGGKILYRLADLIEWEGSRTMGKVAIYFLAFAELSCLALTFDS